jgi:hypothetical protein
MPDDTSPTAGDPPRPRKGWFRIPNEVFACASRIGPHGMLVYVALAHHADRDGRCWPSLSTLENETGLARATIVKETKSLKELGLLRVSRLKRSNLYELGLCYGLGKNKHNPYQPVKIRSRHGFWFYFFKRTSGMSDIRIEIEKSSSANSIPLDFMRLTEMQRQEVVRIVREELERAGIYKLTASGLANTTTPQCLHDSAR